MGLGMGWIDLCAGLFYEHRFAMLLILTKTRKNWARKSHGVLAQKIFLAVQKYKLQTNIVCNDIDASKT